MVVTRLFCVYTPGAIVLHTHEGIVADLREECLANRAASYPHPFVTLRTKGSQGVQPLVLMVYNVVDPIPGNMRRDRIYRPSHHYCYGLWRYGNRNGYQNARY